MLQVAMLPLWEMFLYLLLSFGFHFYSFYEVYKVSREYEEELEREFELEKDTLFWGLKKDPTDFEWTFWMEWGKERIIWLLLGHLMVSQMSRLFMEKYQPWCLMAYGMVACWFLLGINGLAVLLLHIAISFSVAQFQTAVLTWLCSLLLLSALRVPALEEAMRGWYDSENEYYLLLFTLTVRCLYYTSFSLEYCWHGSTQKRYHSFFWMLAYMFYYPVFHNGPIMTFNEFTKQPLYGKYILLPCCSSLCFFQHLRILPQHLGLQGAPPRLQQPPAPGSAGAPGTWRTTSGSTSSYWSTSSAPRTTGSGRTCGCGSGAWRCWRSRAVPSEVTSRPWWTGSCLLLLQHLRPPQLSLLLSPPASSAPPIPPAPPSTSTPRTCSGARWESQQDPQS